MSTGTKAECDYSKKQIVDNKYDINMNVKKYINHIAYHMNAVLIKLWFDM